MLLDAGQSLAPQSVLKNVATRYVEIKLCTHFNGNRLNDSCSGPS